MPSLSKNIIAEYPLSYGQKALWFVQRLHPSTAVHNVTHAGRIVGDLEPEILRSAFQTIVDRHPVLRTTFVQSDGEPLQRVHAQADVAFTVIDAGGWAPDHLQERMAKEIYRPFDLEAGPLMRVFLYRETPTSHILLLCLHHIITDMWSCALLLHEFSLLYMRAREGRPADLPPAGLPYADFVRLEAQTLAGQEGDRLWKFWKEYLKGNPLPVVLHTDRPRPRVPSHHGSTESLRLDSSVAIGLRRLSKQHGAMLHMTMFALFATLLHRYTGQDDILIGTPKALRGRALAWVMGYLINPVVVRLDLSGDPSFSAFLSRVKGSFLNAFAHATFPFPLLVERLHPRRDISRPPIVQVMFSWQKTFGVVDSQSMTAIALNEQQKQVSLNGLPIESFRMDHLAVPFDLTLMAAEATSDEITLTLEYNRDLFERNTVNRFLKQLSALSAYVVDNPDSPVSRIPLMSARARDELLSGWMPLQKSDDGIPFVHVHVAERARERPDACAITGGGSSLTYAGLDRQANRLARYLQAQGVVPETMVAVCLERSIDAMIALVGVLKAGGIYLPLDPSFPADRKSFMLEDAGTVLVVTRSDLVPHLPKGSWRLVCLDTDRPGIDTMDDEDPVCVLAPDNGAYVIYTSGSTGVPKGVLISHAALAAHCCTMGRHYRLTDRDRILQFASLNFDASLEQILPTLMAGATLILRDNDLWSPQEFVRRLRDHGLSIINLSPSYWHQIAQNWSTAPNEPPVPELRLVIIGGDVMHAETVRLWLATAASGARLLNAYGPTETTITALTHEVDRAMFLEHPPARIPVGRPLPTRTAYVLDTWLEPVPTGVPGELYLGGEGVARGYVQRPDLTAERFLPDPFSDAAGARMYRSGDFVRRREDGSLEFLARTDYQVKVRGFRVELGEIEHMLARHPGVREAAVTTYPTPAGDNDVIAYIVRRNDGAPSDEEIRAFLGKTLPPYMVPRAFVPLENMPRTPGGKIDRRSLPAPTTIPSNENRPVVEAQTPIQHELVAIWKQILAVTAIGVTDDFFDLGGHSILAMQVVTQINAKFGIEISLRDFFESPTIETLAPLVEERLLATEDDEQLVRLLEEIEGADDQKAPRS